MKKAILFLILTLLLSLGFGISATADSEGFILDMSGLLADEAVHELDARELSDKFGFAVAYACVPELDSMTEAEYSQRLYSSKIGFTDGILLLDCAVSESIYVHKEDADGIISPEDSERLASVYSQAVSYDEAVSSYLELAEDILSSKLSNNTTRDLVLLEDYGEAAEEASPTPDAESGDALLSLDGAAAQPQQSQPTTPAIPSERQYPLVYDAASVIDPVYLSQLNEKAEKISRKYGCDIAAVFVSSTGGRDIQAFADDFYDYNGYGYGDDDNGILFLVSVGDRAFAISTYAAAGYTFSDYGQQYMDSRYIDHLRNSDWGRATEAYIDACAELLEYEKANGVPYDVSSRPEKDMTAGSVLISLIAGFLFAFIPIGSMKKKMHNVHQQVDAADYVSEGSFRLHTSRDRYITSRITKVPRPKENDNNRSGGMGGSSFHTSSSGRIHGGHSGRF